MPPEDHSKSPTVRHITSIDYIELYDHISRCKPVYFFNTNFVIRDYHLTSITTKSKNMFDNIIVSLVFFRPYMSIAEIENHFHYIVDYNGTDDNRGRWEVYDITIPLYCLSTKPFNSKAGNLLYGKKGT